MTKEKLLKLINNNEFCKKNIVFLDNQKFDVNFTICGLEFMLNDDSVDILNDIYLDTYSDEEVENFINYMSLLNDDLTEKRNDFLTTTYI